METADSAPINKMQEIIRGKLRPDTVSILLKHNKLLERNFLAAPDCSRLQDRPPLSQAEEDDAFGMVLGAAQEQGDDLLALMEQIMALVDLEDRMPNACRKPVWETFPERIKRFLLVMSMSKEAAAPVRTDASSIPYPPMPMP